MTLITRFGTALVLLAAVLPFAAANGIPTGSASCNEQEFWYHDKGCCLPYGGVPSPPPPPEGNDCPPVGFYWHEGQGCCVPSQPPPPDCPPPQCKKGWDWFPGPHSCQPQPSPPPPPPNPSGHYHNGWKRSLKSRSPSLCPTGLDACPIASLTSGDYECLDTSAELESCGGCASIGKGQDCTTIRGAWNVGCEQGRCAVYTCSAGFSRSHDGKSCIAL
jgi:hypothetical protein